jgi:endo-1,4-beta-xylanase
VHGVVCRGAETSPNVQIMAANFNWLDSLAIMGTGIHPVRDGAVPPSWLDGCLGPPPSSGGWDFRGMDMDIDFAARHGMQIRAGFLVWYYTTPKWLSMLPPSSMLAQMRSDIQTIMTRYRGRVAVWDVVNEALSPSEGTFPPCSDPSLADGSPRGCVVNLPNGPINLRNSVWSRRYGVSYIVEAFRQARRFVAPGALLEYNEYGTEGDTAKWDDLLTLLAYVRSQGVRIDSVGFQAHVLTQGDEAHAPPAAHFAAHIDTIKSLGYRVHITELDVSLVGDNLTIGTPAYRTQLDAQRSIFHDVVQACRDNTHCDEVTFFDASDPTSWLPAAAHRPANFCDLPGAPHPDLFDCSYQRKPAYQGVLDALLGH